MQEHLKYLLSTISIYWPDIRIWTNNPIKKGYIFCIVWFFVKLQIHHILNKLSEWLRAEATQSFWGSGHLFLADKETFIFSLTKILC